MAMATYAARRTFFYVIVFFVVTFLVFFSIDAATHPITTVIIDSDNPDSVLFKHTFKFPSKPVPVQYGEWLRGFFTGDWGMPMVLGGPQ